ncbi:hypothetical protein KR222_008962 [Zaprionus bogoriensis]|nr:hypothetical protein KR222_008962 [Zaprionus bogoriensis]
MAFNWICIAFTLLLCLLVCTRAAPSGEDLSKFGDLERTLKELATSVLAMSGAASPSSAGMDLD